MFDLSIGKFSTPNIKKHKKEWYCQKWGNYKEKKTDVRT